MFVHSSIFFILNLKVWKLSGFIVGGEHKAGPGLEEGVGEGDLVALLQAVFRIRFGSGFNQVRKKKIKQFHVLKCWMFSFEC